MKDKVEFRISRLKEETKELLESLQELTSGTIWNINFNLNHIEDKVRKIKEKRIELTTLGNLL